MQTIEHFYDFNENTLNKSLIVNRKLLQCYQAFI